MQTRTYDLAAALMVGAAGWSGIQYIEVGSGDPTWPVNPPAPSAAEVGLVNPLARIPLRTAQFLTGAVNADKTFVTQVAPSRFVLVDFYVPVGSAAGTWREAALVGGNATGVLGTGMYLAVIRFAPRVRGINDDPKIEQFAFYL